MVHDHACPPPIADAGMDGVVVAGQSVAPPGANENGAGAPVDGVGTLGGHPDSKDGSDAEKGSERTGDVPDVIDDNGAPAEGQKALMRILLAWSSAVDSHTHVPLMHALTAHVWENREWVFEPYS